MVKQVHLNKKGNCACNNGENNSDQNISTSMAQMTGNDVCPRGKFGDSLQQTNWFLDS